MPSTGPGAVYRADTACSKAGLVCVTCRTLAAPGAEHRAGGGMTLARTTQMKTSSPPRRRRRRRRRAGKVADVTRHQLEYRGVTLRPSALSTSR